MTLITRRASYGVEGSRAALLGEVKTVLLNKGQLFVLRGKLTAIPFLMPLPGVELQQPAEKSKHKHSNTSRITLSCGSKTNKVCSL